MLEDFFTLTEMKDGIPTVARIGELVSEIEKLDIAVGFNTADLIRQCSTAARTLSSTRNEECLQHFVQLNGVTFLNQWLQGARNCGDDISNAAADLIVAVLTALECLPVDNTQSTSCGVLQTVEHLVAHGNTEINQKARALCQKWGGVPKCSTVAQDTDTEVASSTDQLHLPEGTLEPKSDKNDGANEAAVIAEDKSRPEVMNCSGVSLPNHSLTNDNRDIMKQPPVLMSPSSSDGNAILGDGNPSVPSLVSHSSLKNVSGTEESFGTNDVRSAKNCMLPSDSLGAKSGAAQVAPPDVTTEAKSSETNKPGNLVVRNKMEVEGQNASASLGIKKSESFSAEMSCSEKNTMEALNHLANVSSGLQDSSDDESMDKEEEPTSSSDTDVKGAVNELRLKRCVTSFGDSSRAAETKFIAAKGKTSSAEFDDTDALEVARLVALEVEREVIDYRGPFCGSPDINSRSAASPDIEARQQHDPPIDESNDNKSSTTGEDSESSSSIKEDGSGITDESGPFSRKHTRTMEVGDIDLNENQCTEEIDCHKSAFSNSINLSTPIAVAASRASSVFPARLQFEGGLGWKGSAATSAFRPASPWRTPDGEKSVSASAHKTSNALFDLNVAESDNATAGEPLSTAIFPLSSDLPSRDTFAAVGMRGGLGLDLNGPSGDEEGAITTSNVPSFWNRQNCNGDWSQPSSSSSSRQPAVRNFDLNDNMSIVDGSSRSIDEFSVKNSGRDMADLSAVTIMGKRIVLGQKEHSHQNQHNFLGPSTESRVPARFMQTYGHTPPDYSRASYPPQSALPFLPPFYAPGGSPYMVDAKGAPVIPPLSGFGGAPLPGLGIGISHPSYSSRAIPPSSGELSYFHPSTHPANTRAVQASSSELNYYHPSMDFNYGRPSEGGRTESGSYWPVSFQGQTIFVDERTRSMSQGGSSGVVLKRKEPDSGWDLYSHR